tara:strand:+ start:51 stop:533 length:483 start_codon:yes stop_codon:yes gene_type:complete
MQVTVKKITGETVFAIEIDVMQAVMAKVLEEMEKEKVVKKGSSTLSETEIKGDLLVLSKPDAKKDKDSNKSKRPLNSFQRFSRDYHEEVKNEVFADVDFSHTDRRSKNTEIARRLGILWKNTSEDIKFTYKKEYEFVSQAQKRVERALELIEIDNAKSNE